MRLGHTYRAARREAAKTEHRSFKSFPWPWQWHSNGLSYGPQRNKPIEPRYVPAQRKPQKVWQYDAHGNAKRVLQ